MYLPVHMYSCLTVIVITAIDTPAASLRTPLTNSDKKTERQNQNTCNQIPQLLYIFIFCLRDFSPCLIQ